MSGSPACPLQQDLVQETLLGEALEHGPGAIVLDEEGGISPRTGSPASSGYTREELLAGGAAVLVFDPARLKTAMELMASGELQSGVAELKRKDGTALACEYRVGGDEKRRMPFFVVVFGSGAKQTSRDGRIRTGGLPLPKRARYQAAPRPGRLSVEPPLG